MVIGLGVDLIELDRVSAAFARWGARLVGRLMDPREAAALPAAPRERTRALALAIAAKEAASKALGTGWTRGVRWRDVIVELGEAPRITLAAKASARALTLGSSGRGALRLEVRGNLVLAEYRLLS
jgi:holo-[acyl-carrier protein] synthase